MIEEWGNVLEEEEESQQAVTPKTYIVVEEDIDPWCGVHPVCAFLSEEDAEEFARRMNKKFLCTRYYVMERKMFRNLEDAIKAYYLDE